jgi:hypothetical protein
MDPPGPHPHPEDKAVLADPRLRPRPAHLSRNRLPHLTKSKPQPFALATRGGDHHRDARTIQDAMQAKRRPQTDVPTAGHLRVTSRRAR